MTAIMLLRTQLSRAITYMQQEVSSLEFSNQIHFQSTI